MMLWTYRRCRLRVVSEEVVVVVVQSATGESVAARLASKARGLWTEGLLLGLNCAS